MKGLRFTFFGALILAFWGAGCGSASSARVIRLIPNLQGNQCRLSVNGSLKTEIVSAAELTNRLDGLRLHHGDIVLFGGPPNFMPERLGNAREWLSDYFDSSKVAIYIYPDAKAHDIFSVPVFHWIAPFDNPRSLNNATFFCEGKFLGKGMAGYEAMTSMIQESQVREVFVLGSLYDTNRGFWADEAPYADQKGLLDDALTRGRKTRLGPSQWIWPL